MQNLSSFSGSISTFTEPRTDRIHTQRWSNWHHECQIYYDFEELLGYENLKCYCNGEQENTMLYCVYAKFILWNNCWYSILSIYTEVLILLTVLMRTLHNIKINVKTTFLQEFDLYLNLIQNFIYYSIQYRTSAACKYLIRICKYLLICNYQRWILDHYSD